MFPFDLLGIDVQFVFVFFSMRLCQSRVHGRKVFKLI
jgi:hypothetical protein